MSSCRRCALVGTVFFYEACACRKCLIMRCPLMELPAYGRCLPSHSSWPLNCTHSPWCNVSPMHQLSCRSCNNTVLRQVLHLLQLQPSFLSSQLCPLWLNKTTGKGLRDRSKQQKNRHRLMNTEHMYTSKQQEKRIEIHFSSGKVSLLFSLSRF